MNQNPKQHPLPDRTFLFQDYDIIDYEILQFEQKLEAMERNGHHFCTICCIEVVNSNLCNKCDVDL